MKSSNKNNVATPKKNPWDEEDPIDDRKYFVDRDMGLEGLSNDIKNIGGLDSGTKLIHVFGNRGVGKSSVLHLLRKAANEHLIAVMEHPDETYALSYKNAVQRDANRLSLESRFHANLVIRILKALWKEKYERGWYPATKSMRSLGWSFSENIGKFGIGSLEVTRDDSPAFSEGRDNPTNYIIREIRSVIGSAKRRRQRGVAIFLDDADWLVTTPFLISLVTTLNNIRTGFPCVLVMASVTSFPELLKRKAADINVEPSENELIDIRGVQRKLTNVHLRPYEVGNESECRDVINKAINQVLTDWCNNNGKEYIFDPESADKIAWRSAGHLYLVNLLCHCCFDTHTDEHGDKIYLTENALRKAVAKVKGANEEYQIQIDPAEEEGRLLWEDARGIQREIGKVR